jgi:hypothetical protein
MKNFYHSQKLNNWKLGVLTAFLMVSYVLTAATYYSLPGATDFNATASWGTNTNGTGANPGIISNADDFIIQNGSVMSLTGNATVRSLTINAGTLTVAANTLTIEIAGAFNSSLTVNSGGTLTVSGGDVTLNGNFLVAFGGTLNQSSGTIRIDGNNGGSATGSVAAGTAMLQINSSSLNLTGGSIIIVDPNAGTSGNAFDYSASTPHYNMPNGSDHTVQFGDGVSTDATASTTGFRHSTWTSAGRFMFQNVILNLMGTGNRNILTAAWTHGINGNLTIINGDYQTTSALTLAGNLTNSGTMSSTSTLTLGTFISGTTGPTSNSQTISGTGVFRNSLTASTANYLSLLVNNVSAGGVTFSNANSLLSGSNTGTVSSTFTLTNGLINTGANKFILGVSSTILGAHTYTSGGFGSGSTFARWVGTTGTGSTITAGTQPTFGVGSFPFISGNPVAGFVARHFHRATTIMASAGTIEVTYNDGFGLTTLGAPVSESSLTFDRYSNANWVVALGNGATATSTATVIPCVAINANSAIPVITANNRILINSALIGTHAAGTNLPMVQRSISPSSLVGTYTIGSIGAEVINYSIASGDFSVGSNWNTGVVPACGAPAIIRPQDSMFLSSGTVSSGSLTVNGILNINGGNLTMGCNKNDSLFNNGKLYVGSGTLNINGRIDNRAGSTFVQTGGTINVDGNSGTAATSVATGAPLMWYQSNAVTMTGGNINIINPHRGTATADRAITYVPSSTPFPLITAGHTTTFGNGVSTIAPGQTGTGGLSFGITSGSRFQFGNFVLNTMPAQGRTSLNTATTVFHGDLTITKGTLLSSGNNIAVAGNVVNNDTIINSGGLILAKVLNANMATPTYSPDSSLTTVTTGTNGRWFNNTTLASSTANMASLTINHHVTLGGVSFVGAMNNNFTAAQPANSISVSGTLTFTSGKVTIPSTLSLILGTSTANGSISYTAGGFTSGSTFGRGFATTTTGTTITAAAAPATGGIGFYPFITNTGVNRHFDLVRVTPTGAGILAIKYNESAGYTSGLSLADPSFGYVVNNRSGDNWVASNLSGTLAAASFNLAITAPNVFGGALSADSGRILQVAGYVGTHQRGTVTPVVQRTGLTLANLTSGAFYVGANIAQTPNGTIASGDWTTASTWSKGTVPTCSDDVVINDGHTVTVNTTAVSNNITINQSGTLLLGAGNTLTAGCTNNMARLTINGGALNMSGGTLTVNGQFALNANVNGVFMQSGGDVIVDGNSGTLSTSINSHICDFYSHTANTLQLTGGTFTVVDPSAAIGAPRHAFKVLPSLANTGSGPGWTLKLGNGSSTTPGGSTEGFVIEMAGTTTTNIFKISNLEINNPGSTTALNRIVIPFASRNTVVNNFTLTDGVFRTNGSLYVSNNLTNNDTFINNANTVFMADYNNAAVLASSNAQSIAGSGYFTNNATYASKTAELLNLTVNNNNATGVTPNMPLTISGTLTMTTGILNSTASNYIQLGVPGVAGTLTGTAFSNTTHINGVFRRAFASGSTGTSALSNVHLMPVGTGGIYLPLWVSPTTTSNVTFRTEAFTSNSGSMGSGVTSLNGNNWECLPLGSGVTGAFVRAGDAALVSTNLLLTSSSSGGTFEGVAGGSAYSAGTPRFVSSSALITPFDGYFGTGDMTLCTAPLAQPSGLAFKYVTNTSVSADFSAASPAPTGYLVVRYPASGTTTAPVDYTTYAVGAALGTGTVVANVLAAPFTFNATGLIASTAYDFYVYSFSNSGCAGPAYLTSSPLTASITTCATAVSSTGVTLSYNGQTSSGFTLNWTGATTPPAGGAEYVLDLATDPLFTNIVSGFNALNVGPVLTYAATGLNASTTYWARLRVKEIGTSCTSPAVTANWTSIATLPASSVSTIFENFDAPAPATTNTVFPGGWYKVTSAGTVNKNTTGSFTAPNSMSISNSATLTARGTLAVPTVTNNTSGSHRARFRMQVSSGASKMYFGYLATANDPTSFVRLDSFIPGTVNAEFISVAISTPSGSDVLAFQPDGSATVTFYIDNFNWEVVPACTMAEAGTTTVSNATLCTPTGLGTTIRATGYSKDSSNLLYTWQTSTNGSSWTNKTTTSSTYKNLIDTPTASTHYRLIVECVSSSVLMDSSNAVIVSAINPSITSTTADTVCGTGSVMLIASGTDTAFNWFRNATGGAPLSTNDTFITTINSDSTFYVENGIGQAGLTFTGSGTGDGAWNKYTTTGSFQTTLNTGAKIVVTNQITISSVDIYPSAAIGTAFTIAIRTGSATGAIAQTYSGVTSVQNSGTPTVAETHNVNFTLAPGTYWMNFPTTNPNTWRSGIPSPAYVFPWALTNNNATLEFDLTPSYQYYFYNLKVGSGCFSSRTPVVAKSLTPPAITPSASPATICQGQSSALNVTSTNASYAYTWSHSLGTGASKSVTPMANTTYSVSATDNSGGTYDGCSATGTINVVVNQTPSPITFDQSDTTFGCANSVKQIIPSGGLLSFSNVSGTGTAANTTTTHPNVFNDYYENAKTQMIFLASELTAMGMVANSIIDTLSYNISATNSGTYPSLDNFSINAGLTTTAVLATTAPWIALPNVVYGPITSLTVPVGLFKFPLSTPIVWDGTSNLAIEINKFDDITNSGLTYYTTNPIGTNSTTTTARYGYTEADNAVITNANPTTVSTQRPNIIFSHKKALNNVWSPTTGLYTNSAGTTAYTGTNKDTIYANPTSTTKYYYTATDPGTGCFAIDSITDSVTSSATNVTLASATVSGCVPQCTEGSGWTYYTNPSTPSNYIFAINKGATGMTGETISVEVLGSNPSSTSSAGINQQHGSYLMKRGWDVTGTVPTGSVSVRFFYDPADTTSVNTDRDAGFAALSAGSLAVKTGFEWFKSTGTPYNASWRALVVGNKFPSSHVKLIPTFGSINGVNYVEFSGITSFSGGSGGSGFGPPSSGGGVGLPVTWAGFDAVAKESGNDLTWKTASEVNTSHFEVEYSYDGVNYNKSAIKVPAAGSSQTIQTYNYTHKEVSTFVYYRIKQVDMDSRFDYSATKLVKRTDAKTFQVSVYPIPVLDDQVLNVEVKAIDKSDLFITILDMNGRIVKSRTTKPTTNSILVEKINVSNLSNGLYQVVIQNGQGKEVVKFSK